MAHEEAVRDWLREGGQIVEVADVTGAPWIEIDFPGDVSRAATEVLPLLQPLSESEAIGRAQLKNNA
jgi:choline kinase